MKKERVEFGERLCQALRRARMSESAKELADLLPAHGGEAVTPQAAHQWIRGKSIPRRNNLRALANLLGVTPEWLLGEEPAKKRQLGETPGSWTTNPHDRLAIDAYLALVPERRKIVREMIKALAAKPEAGRRP